MTFESANVRILIGLPTRVQTGDLVRMARLLCSALAVEG